MTMKTKLKRACRVVQDRLGGSYQGALNRLRAWDDAGIPIDEALANVLDGVEPPKREAKPGAAT